VDPVTPELAGLVASEWDDLHRAGVTRVLKKLLKLVFPHRTADDLERDELETYLALATECRQRVLDQLAVMLPEEFGGVWTIRQPVTSQPTQIARPHDFGGNGPIVHLAHANGFPPGTYSPLAETLTDRYHVIGLPSRPLWPDSRPEDTPDWHPMADDLVRGLDTLGLTWASSVEPSKGGTPSLSKGGGLSLSKGGIVGVGHSMGGVLTLWAAVRRSDLFRAVVLIDPVILPPAWLLAMQLLHPLGLQRRLPLVQGALRRRRTWPSRQACYEHYRGKPFFATWPDVSLRAYVEAGTLERAGDQVVLAYPPEWEAHIFATPPADVWRAVPRLRTPALVIRGGHSDTFRPESQARMERLVPQAHFVTIPNAGHLVPMEHPAETGAVIQDFLGALDFN